MSLIACRGCGTELPGTDKTCPRCGQVFDLLTAEHLTMHESATHRMARWFGQHRLLLVLLLVVLAGASWLACTTLVLYWLETF